MAETDSLLTTKQLLELLQVDRITVYRMLNDGRLEGFKVGGQWRFSRQEIERWLREQRGDLGVTEMPRGGDDLQPSPRALPLSCVCAIQDIFAEALRVGTVTTAMDGVPITPVAHSCDFCNLILGTSEGRERCIASWRRAAEPGSTPRHAVRHFTCHAGLHHVTARIKVKGEHVGAIHAGQFVASEADRQTERGRAAERIAELAAVTGIPEKRLAQALSRLPVCDEDRRHQVGDLLQRVADTFAEIGEERISLLGRLQRIAEISSI